MATLLGGRAFTSLELVILALFAVTFGWITIAFWTAVVGFLLVAFRRDPLSLRRSAAAPGEGAPIRSRTALVMPIRNEDPSRVAAGLASVLRSLARTGHGASFDAYLLSDTTDPAIAREEAAAWAALRADPDLPAGLFYRRRTSTTGRKAGNIADFCRRWGSRYEFMVVLDADSVMEGRTVVELVRTMQANPDAGLIQTLPNPILQDSLFGRILQFARWVYGPMVATGLSFWQGDAGNYWGHNAIVRVRPFSDHCGLPRLPGDPPLGGEILSHDFVEAAFLRRAGWKVYLTPLMEGSYEEVPGNILDYADRDRRWSQGNLQHLRLLPEPGLHHVSRMQLALGAMSYLTSPLWLSLLAASTLYAVISPGPAQPSLPGGQAVGGGWAGGGAGPVVPLLAIVVVVLFLPKVLAITLAALRHPGRFGGRARLVVSGVLEMLAAVLLAPLMMLYHSHFVIGILRGRSAPWRPQVRGGRGIAWGEAWRRTTGPTAVGLAWAGLALYHSSHLFLWLTPIFGGLIAAAPLVRWSSGRSAGEWARRRGLFLAPCETAPPRVVEEVRQPRSILPVSRAARGFHPELPAERPRAMAAQPLQSRLPLVLRRRGIQE